MSSKAHGDQGFARDVTETMRQAWNAAMATFDYEALSKIYDEEAIFFGSTAELHKGREGVKSYFTRIAGESCAIDLRDEQAVALGPDIVAVSGYVTFALGVGGEIHSIPMRMTMVFRKRSDGWKIAVHHASPIPA